MDVIERLTMGLGRAWDENDVYYNEAQKMQMPSCMFNPDLVDC